ncbi:16S rRNA (uracil(1498)-N(3))-methyltransferase [Robbsia sp. Bb-Pol-6]|uniref:Ribosomal RNA small subunit methyltransferase E n=1 Tax=Robbsia betulipollinis TaxID=2981849 RepID=A0ABT3ZQP2_9BURK|nr:16S rRNA (uracil(1498)-N(3))-methyltransferase [Robbsia betulipollinis]MCY0388884.1 16S rRNA (uracil(1498)-N(3))-methyltransferase [Robbsia betulipollinis]
MPRFFIDSPLRRGASLALPDTVVRHLQVLRLKPGDALTLFNGVDAAHAATLADLGKKHAMATLGDALPSSGTEPPYRIELAQGVASNEKMDWLIEKAVELGVSRIVPLLAERSVVRLSGERALRRHAHWQALVRAACEQCARDVVPEVAAPSGFQAWLDAETREAAPAPPPSVPSPADDAPPRTDGPLLRLLLSPRATLRFADLPQTPPPVGVRLLIGPEGGWSPEEEARAREVGYTPLSLGPRILRAETAGIALLAALAGRWGGW